jgi:hypothetical protein
VAADAGRPLRAGEFAAAAGLGTGKAKVEGLRSKVKLLAGAEGRPGRCPGLVATVRPCLVQGLRCHLPGRRVAVTLGLALVRDMRELRAPSSTREVAAFETDVLSERRCLTAFPQVRHRLCKSGSVGGSGI